jgi:hypothetical protein
MSEPSRCFGTVIASDRAPPHFLAGYGERGARAHVGTDTILTGSLE